MKVPLSLRIKRYELFKLYILEICFKYDPSLCMKNYQEFYTFGHVDDLFKYCIQSLHNMVIH